MVFLESLHSTISQKSRDYDGFNIFLKLPKKKGISLILTYWTFSEKSNTRIIGRSGFLQVIQNKEMVFTMFKMHMNQHMEFLVIILKSFAQSNKPSIIAEINLPINTTKHDLKEAQSNFANFQTLTQHFGRQCKS